MFVSLLLGWWIVLKLQEPKFFKEIIYRCLMLVQSSKELLATGQSYVSLHFTFRLRKSTINDLILDICDAIIRHYYDKVVAFPTCPEDWEEIEQAFGVRCTYPLPNREDDVPDEQELSISATRVFTCR